MRRAVGVAQDAPRCRGSPPAPGAARRCATVSSAASRAAAGSAATASPARSNSSTSRSARSSGGDGEARAEVGQALADQALGRVDEQDRRLQPALPVDQVGLLPGVLEVVARVGLVGDVWTSVRGADRQVRVDVDPRAAAAVEPVVAAPRLVGDERDPQVLAVGQPEQSRPRVRGTAPTSQSTTAGRRSTGISRRAIPGRQPLGQRPVAGQQLVEPRRGRRRTRRPAGAAARTRSSARRARGTAARRRRARRPASRARPAGRRASRAGRARRPRAPAGRAARRRRRAAGPAIGAAPCRPGP